MSGFLLNLKASKISKPKAGGKGLFQLKKVPTKSSLAQNVLQAQEDDEEPQKTSIDAFESHKGAFNGSEAVSKPKELVIIPENLSVGLAKRHPKPNPNAETESASVSKTSDDLARQSLLYGETFSTQEQMTLDLNKNSNRKAGEITEQDYEDVPVEQFGAALLRGMGWDGKMSRESRADVSHRQKGVVLGIGSQLIGQELEAELMKGSKLSVPLVRKEKGEGKRRKRV